MLSASTPTKRASAFVAHVGTLSGALCSITTNRDATVSDLKVAINLQTGTPIVEQQIVFQDSPLPDDYCLGDLESEALFCHVTLLRTACPRIFAIGGNEDPGAEVFDLSVGAWAAVDPGPRTRYGLSVAAGGRQIYVLGGENELGVVFASVEAFDTESGSFGMLPDMLEERYNAAAVWSDGRVFVVGGTNDGGNILGSGEMLDLGGNKWTALPVLEMPRTALGIATLSGGICAVGGLSDEADSLASVERLELSALYMEPAAAARYGGQAQWSAWPALAVPRYLLAVTATKDQVFAIGGKDANGCPLGVVEVLDAWRNTWSTLPSMRVSRHSFAACAAEAGIFVMGGRDTESVALQSAALYSLSDSTWCQLPDMIAVRSGVAGVAAV